MSTTPFNPANLYGLADKWETEAARYDEYATTSPYPEMHKAIARTLRALADELRDATPIPRRRCNENCLGGHTHESDCALRDDHVGDCDSLQGVA